MSKRAQHRLLLAAEAQAARAKFGGTLAQIRRKANAKVIVGEIVDLASARGREALGEAVTAGRRRPWLTAVTLAAAGLAFALRTGIVRRRIRETNNGDDRSSSRLEIEHDRS